MRHFSLAIIGSGSGNVLVPEDPARGPVALIEAGDFGGTCLLRGCIPSKIFAHTADVAAEIRRAASTGLGVAEMARGQYWIHPALTEVVENALLKLLSTAYATESGN